MNESPVNQNANETKTEYQPDETVPERTNVPAAAGLASSGGGDKATFNLKTDSTGHGLAPTTARKRRFFKRPAVLIIVTFLILLGIGAICWTGLHRSSKPKDVAVTKIVPVLHYGTLGGPVGSETIFPNAQGTSESLNVSLQIYEGLVGYRGEKIVPLLATSWTNPDTSTWVFNIARNVRFQDGTSMTAADVARSLNADMQNENYNVYLNTVKTVTASGADEVTITTRQPDSLLLNRLVYALIFKQNGSKYIGTGPYTIDQTAADDSGHVSLQAYSGYHGGTPKAKRVTVTVYTDAKSLVAAYNNKKVDLFVDPKVGTAEASLNAPRSTFTYTVAGSAGLRANTLRAGGVLANAKVREAVAYALDRQALEKASGGTFIPTRDIVPKSVIGYDPAATFPDLDLAKSKQLQTEAGYPNGAPLTFMYYKGAQPAPPLIIAQLQAAGFKVTENVVASGQDFVAQAVKGNYDLLSMTYFSNFNDATDIFTGMIDSKDADFPSYSNPAADALINASEADFSPASHIQKVKAINKYIADNYLWIPVYTTVPGVYYKPGLQVRSNYVISQQITTFWQIGQSVTEAAKD